jgi:hypothetical protein
MKQGRGELRGYKEGRFVGFRVGSHLPLQGGNGLAPFPLDSGTGRFQARTMVDVLHLRRRRSWHSHLPHVTPLFVHVWARPHPEVPRTLGAAPKISGTGRFQDQEKTVAKTVAAHGPPSMGTTGDKGPKGPLRQDQKKPGVPVPGTHLSKYEDTDSLSEVPSSMSMSRISS